MDIETLRRLVLARHLYELGLASSRTANDMHLFSAANLFQDAIEAFLLAVADHVGAGIDQNTKFDKYFVVINDKISPKELPFKSKIIRLNRIRVDSKHYGIQPDRDECTRLSIAIREFFDEVCSSVFGVPFSSVSAIDLLKDGDTKTELLRAKEFLENGALEECAISCRKALYLEIERDYDISAYRNGPPTNILAGFSNAPHFAKSKEYIDENVYDSTDYIVYDHSSVNEKLLTQGADNTAFWNVWRLTPEVFKDRNGHWVVRHEFRKLDAEVLAERIEYIFNATLDVVLSIHRTRQAAVWSEGGKYVCTLSQELVPVHKKADESSEVVAHTPKGLYEVTADFRIEGLNGDAEYWHIAHFGNGHVWGYVHEKYVK